MTKYSVTTPPTYVHWKFHKISRHFSPNIWLCIHCTVTKEKSLQFFIVLALFWGQWRIKQTKQLVYQFQNTTITYYSGFDFCWVFCYIFNTSPPPSCIEWSCLWFFISPRPPPRFNIGVSGEKSYLSPSCKILPGDTMQLYHRVYHSFNTSVV